MKSKISPDSVDSILSKVMSEARAELARIKNEVEQLKRSKSAIEAEQNEVVRQIKVDQGRLDKVRDDVKKAGDELIKSKEQAQRLINEANAKNAEARALLVENQDMAKELKGIKDKLQSEIDKQVAKGQAIDKVKNNLEEVAKTIKEILK